jgi:hypothetical protein
MFAGMNNNSSLEVEAASSSASFNFLNWVNW